MDVSSAGSSSLQAMASRADDEAGILVLKKAMDLQASSMLQLLQTMSSPPQAEQKGTLVDVQA